MKRSIPTALVVLASALATTLAAAPAAHAQAGGQHTGFFVRPRVGFTYWDASGNSLDTNGVGEFASVDIGGAIRPNLQIYGQLRDLWVDGPQQTQPDGSVIVLDNTQATMPAIGGGVSYYFEPLNLYVGGTLLITRLTNSYPCGKAPATCETDTDWGLGLSVEVGKEWVVSPSWGIGVGGDLYFASLSQPIGPNLSYDLSADGLAVVFTASYH